jgi:hypothetical protein
MEGKWTFVFMKDISSLKEFSVVTIHQLHNTRDSLNEKQMSLYYKTYICLLYT